MQSTSRQMTANAGGKRCTRDLGMKVASRAVAWRRAPRWLEGPDRVGQTGRALRRQSSAAALTTPCASTRSRSVRSGTRGRPDVRRGALARARDRTLRPRLRAADASRRAGRRIRPGPRRRRRHAPSVHGGDGDKARRAPHRDAALPVSVHGERHAAARPAARCARGGARRGRRSERASRRRCRSSPAASRSAGA